MVQTAGRIFSDPIRVMRRSRMTLNSGVALAVRPKTLNHSFSRAIDKGLSWKMYLSDMNGDRIPYGSCPECSQDTYVAAEWRCALCGHKAASSLREMQPRDTD